MQILGYEVDPVSGERVTYGAQAGQFIVKRERDIAPAMDYTKALRDASGYAKQGIKDSFQHCVHIPDTVAAKMMTDHGFDVYRRSAKEIRLFLRRHRAEYANLFVTAGKI
jgi:hypothetical protein